jgi:cytochrome c556
MKKSKNMLFFLSFFLAVPFLVGAVSEDAQTKHDQMQEEREAKKADRDAKKAEREEVKEEKKEAKEERKQERCDEVEARVKDKIAKYEAGQIKRLNVFKSVQARLNNLVKKVEAKGYDATELKADLEILEQKRETFQNEFEKHVSELKDTQSYACGESEGEFKNQLRNSRTQLKVAREAHTEMRNFFKNEIKGDVAALKSQIEEVLGLKNNETE